MHHRHSALVLFACVLLAACGGGDKTPARQASGGEERLPSPDSANGSVTGMPEPGQAIPPPHPALELPADIVGLSDAPEDAGVDTGPDITLEQQATAQDALAVLRRYYAAINAADFAGAYAAWGDGGRAGGQTLGQFADGFGSTQGVSVQFGDPGRVDAGAGQRHIEIPVTLEARQGDGSIRRYRGSYILQRTVADGASPEQGQWHIAAASLREIDQ